MGLRPHVSFWETTRFRLELDRPRVMGIVNLTPDSFSDGGRWTTAEAALAHAQQLLKDGADILDIGAESSRPGAEPLSDDEEWRRLAPVLTELIRWQVPLSVDTYRAITMRRALDLGVDIINDIWALRQPGALASVQASRCGVCVMHMHGEPQTMQREPMSGDAVKQVLNFLLERLQVLQAAGIAEARICLDPGIGFGKTVEQNFALLREQSQLMALGRPILAAWSRKSSLGAVTGLDVQDRLVPSVAAAVLAVERGARIVRVHDVAATVAALQVWRSIAQV
ncbi:MAG: dihydropteroate synthase [Betaproteobacteria bacterium]|nr:dihydropteroate synthase [Betaproteobacteria bacterium]